MSGRPRSVSRSGSALACPPGSVARRGRSGCPSTSVSAGRLESLGTVLIERLRRAGARPGSVPRCVWLVAAGKTGFTSLIPNLRSRPPGAAWKEDSQVSFFWQFRKSANLMCSVWTCPPAPAPDIPPHGVPLPFWACVVMQGSPGASCRAEGGGGLSVSPCH